MNRSKSILQGLSCLVILFGITLIPPGCSDDENGPEPDDHGPPEHSGVYLFHEVCTNSTGECREDIGGESTFHGQLKVEEDGSASLTIKSHSEAPEVVGMELTGNVEDCQLTLSSNNIPYNCGSNCSGTPCDNGTVSINVEFEDLDNASGTSRGDNCCGDGGWSTWTVNAQRTSPDPTWYSGEWVFHEECISSTGECREDIGGESTFHGQLKVEEDGSASLTIKSHSEAPELVGEELTGSLEDGQLTLSSNSIPYNCGSGCSGTPCDNGTLLINVEFEDLDNASGTARGDNCCGDGGGSSWTINVQRTS